MKTFQSLLCATPILFALIVMGQCPGGGDGFYFKVHLGNVTITASHCG